MDYKTGKLLESIVSVLNDFIGYEYSDKPKEIKNLGLFIDKLRDFQVDINRLLANNEN